MSGKTIIVADDDTAIRTVLTQALKRVGYDVRSVGNPMIMWRMAMEGEGDLIISDVVFPEKNVFDLLPRIRQARPKLPIVVMSAKNTIMTAISAAEHGVFEYLPKPFDLNEMLQVVERGLAQVDLGGVGHAGGAESLDDDLPLVGRSAVMQDIYRVIARMTQTDLTVMIFGESGTGKELVARALHNFSRRKSAAFVAVNMAAIPRELIESELFGHEKGAFTGATARYAGRFEQAQGGTLFLDEIGDMPMESQTRLLRVLQEGEFTSVGGVRPKKTDVRIIAATHRDLGALMRQGKFREDLYFRLNVVPLRLPPLRERRGDIEDLVQHFLKAGASDGLARKSVSPEAMERLREHNWPGNVRELENFIQRLVAIHPENEIDIETVETELRTHTADAATNKIDVQDLPTAVETYLASYFAEFAPETPPAGLHGRVIAMVEAPLIHAALNAVGGNKVRAAELLGINRNTLRTRMRDLGIDDGKKASVR